MKNKKAQIGLIIIIFGIMAIIMLILTAPFISKLIGSAIDSVPSIKDDPFLFLLLTLFLPSIFIIIMYTIIKNALGSG
jgi:hypothetical protein